jgi:hypothetical protein
MTFSDGLDLIPGTKTKPPFIKVRGNVDRSLGRTIFPYLIYCSEDWFSLHFVEKEESKQILA